MEKIGIVTITYNSEGVLPGFFHSLWRQSYSNFVLYVVDNDSKDDTKLSVNAEKDGRVVLIENSKNEGVARANNQGISKALNDGCDYVLLLNNDVEFEQDLLLKLITGMREYSASIVTPKMMYYEPSDVIWFAGSYYDTRKGLLPLHRGINEKDNGQYDNVEKIEYAPTCCALIKKKVFEDVGFMDEKYFVYFDDTDFFYRVLLTEKHDVYYLPNMQFFHKVGSLTKSNASSKERHPVRGDFFIKQNVRNHNYYLKKHGGLYGLLFIFLLFWKWNFKFVLARGVRRDFKTFRLINNAYLQGLFM